MRALETVEKGFLLGLYQRMYLIREFEEQIKFLFLAGSMPGTIHQCQGPEGAVVSEFSTRSLDEKDVFTDPQIARLSQIVA